MEEVKILIIFFSNSEFRGRFKTIRYIFYAPLMNLKLKWCQGMPKILLNKIYTMSYFKITQKS